MASIRSQCVDAIVALLNESSGRPAGLATVERGRLKPYEVVAGLRCILVRTGKNKAVPVGSIDSPIRHHDLEVIVDAVAAGDGSTAPDAAVDPLLVWAVKKLDGAKLANLAEIIVEGETEYIYEQSGDYPLCRASARFLVFHTSQTGDAESRA